MDDDLRVPILPFVEFLISRLGIRKCNGMRYNKAGLRFASNDHVSEVSIVGLDVTLPSTK
jgi:hypothetical protein